MGNDEFFIKILKMNAGCYAIILRFLIELKYLIDYIVKQGLIDWMLFDLLIAL